MKNMKKNKKLICFASSSPFPRTAADAKDVYDWLLGENKSIAKSFKKKIDKVEREFKKKNKEGATFYTSSISLSKKMKETELKPLEVKWKRKPWWKIF